MSARTVLKIEGHRPGVVARVRYSAEWAEYSVAVAVDNVCRGESIYYTNDRADAEATARVMLSLVKAQEYDASQP